MALEENKPNRENPVLKSLTVNPETGEKMLLSSKPSYNKIYYDKTHLDIGAYNEQVKKPGQETMSPDTYLENKDKLEAYDQRLETRRNDYLATNQGTLDKIGNGFVKFGGRVFTSVVGSTVGTLYGLASWARDGEFKSFYDNEFQRGLDGINDYLAEEFKHYYTSSKEDWEIGNFIFDKVFDGLGFATGAVLSSYIGGATTGALMKSFKLTGAIKNGTVNTLKETHKSALKNSVFKNISDTKNVMGKYSTINSLQKLPQSFSSLVTGAVYESGVEARHSYSETREFLINSYKQANEGKAPSNEELKKIDELAASTSNGVFAANMVLVGSGNILQFGKHMGLDFDDFKKIFKTPSYKPIVDATGEKTFVNAGSKFLRKTSAIVKNPIVESQEEMLQSVISGTGKDYALSKYNNNGEGDLNMLLESSLKAFKKTYGSSEGWEEGLIGAIVGSAGVIAPRSTTKADGTKQLPITLAGGIRESVIDWRESERKREEVLKNLNEKGSISSLKAGVSHFIRERGNEIVKDVSLANNDKNAFKNAQDNQFHSYVTSRYEAGMLSSVYDDLNELKTIPLEDFKKAFIPEENRLDYTEDQRIKDITSFERRARNIENTIKFIDKVYDGTNQDKREALIYNQSMVNRIEERMNNILNEINTLTGGQSKTLNVRNEKGERLSKEEIFKDVEKKYKAVNEKQYNALYNDYIKLSDRSNLLLDELYELLQSKEESFIEKQMKDKKESFEAKKQQQAKEKENQRIKKEKEKKAEELKRKSSEQEKETKKSKDVINVAEEAGAFNEKKSVQDDYENEIGMSPQESDILHDRIVQLKDKESLYKFLSELKNQVGVIDMLPKKVTDAIQKKLFEYSEEVRKSTSQKVDPANISNSVEESELTSYNKEVVANNDETSVPPIDISKIEGTKELVEEANLGKTTTIIDDEAIKEDGVQYQGGLLISAFNTVATSTRLYKEVDGKIIRLNENNTEANLDVLSTNLLQRGDKLEIRLYTEPSLKIKDGEGNVIGEEINELETPNQIMEVIDPSNGRVIGYIHKDSYIRPDRVVENIKDTDNIALNKKLLAEFRKEVFDYFNNNNGASYPVIIQDKTGGSIFNVSNDYSIKLADAIEDDTRPTILTVKSDGLYIGRVKLSDHELSYKISAEFTDDFYEKFKGATMIALPAANGTYKVVPVKNPKLSETSISKDIINIAKGFVTKDFKLISESLNNELYTPEILESLDSKELRNLISSYIQRFMYIKNSDLTSKYRLDLQVDNTIIFRDLEGTQSLSLYVTDGQIYNLKQFEQKVNNSLLTVDRTAISENPIITIKDKEGNLKDISYLNFLKENLKVSFKGNNVEMSNGKSEMTYVANPVIALEYDSAPRVSAVGITTKTSPVEDNLFTEEEFLQAANKDTSLEAKKADIEKVQKYTRNRGNKDLPQAFEIPFKLIDTTASNISLSPEEVKRVKLIEMRGRNSQGQLVGTVWIQGNDNLSAEFEVFFNDAELDVLESKKTTEVSKELKETTKKLKKSSLGKLTNKKVRKEDLNIVPLLDVEPTKESEKRKKDCK